MKKEIKEIIDNHYLEINSDNPLKHIFEDTLIYFLEFHVFSDKKGEYDTFLCNIHKNFENGHNCVACNLNDSNRRIQNFLLGYKLFNYDVHTTMTNYIILLYLQVECILEYLNYIKLPEDYMQKNFQVLFTIKRWANFLKHPKAFMLVHHPYWQIDYFNNNLEKKKETIIDTQFVKRYYAGDSKNKELLNILKNKKELVVLFPNPLEIMKDFCDMQLNFFELIKNNQYIREILDDNATLKKYFEEEIN